MRMKKIRLIIVFLVLIVIFSGCRGRTRDEGDINWHSGTKGLEMKFSRGAPPNIVYEGDRYSLVLELWNKGTEEIRDGRIYFGGFDPSIITGITEISPFSISDKKTKYNREGGYMTLDKSFSVQLPSGSDVFKGAKIKATACYTYMTVTDAAICIDPNPQHEDLSDDVCLVRDVGVGGGQGAPVSLTNIQTESMPGKARFRLTIRNVGGGTVIKEERITDCVGQSFKYTDTDWVYIQNVMLGKRGSVECTPNPVKLNNGVGYAYCTAIGLTGNTAYKTTMSAELLYGYKQSIEKSIEIRSSRY